MYMKLNRFIVSQNLVNSNGILVKECHLYLMDGFHSGIFLLPRNVDFSPDNQKLREFTRDYGELIGILPVSSTKNRKKD